jgi:hypothetical protein
VEDEVEDEPEDEVEVPFEPAESRESREVVESGLFESVPVEAESDALSRPDPSVEFFASPAVTALSSFAFDERAVERSFFAQPLPLKWIVGATHFFVIVLSAPHSGQNFGPGSLIPWMTSVTFRQFEQV